MPPVEVTKPAGGFYLFPNFTRLITADVAPEGRHLYVYERLMDRGVATVYGACFGKHFSDNIRLSFSTTPLEAIREGVERIREAFTTR